MEPQTVLAVLPALIALNAFFVAAEYAVVAVRPVHIESMRSRGRLRSAAAMERLKAEPANAIAAIQVCITATNLALGSLGEPAMTGFLAALLGPASGIVPPAAFRTISVALAFFVVTLLTVVFSELLPKALSLRRVEAAAALTAVPVRAIGRAVRPVVWLMNGMASLVSRPLGLGRVESMQGEAVSLEELRMLAGAAEEEGVVTPRERAIILNTLALEERPVRRIMVPRVQVVFLDLAKSLDENRAIVEKHLHTRMPLCDGVIDNVVGLVRAKRFLQVCRPGGDVAVLRGIATPALFAPDLSTTGQILNLFHEQKRESAVLVDEYGGVAGFVTLRDVVDEILGAVDESKALLAEAIRGDLKPPPGALRWTVRGSLPVHEMARLLNVTDWASGYASATVGGLAQERLGDFGRPGDRVAVDGYLLRIVETAGNAILRLEISSAVPRPPA